MSGTKHKSVDKPFLISVLFLVVAGFFIFSSASLGLLARTEDIFRSVTFSQLGLGLVGGTIAMIIASFIDYKLWKRYALPIYIISLVLLALVFIPGIGFGHNGAKRWVDIFGLVTFQPSEVYKICFVFVWAAWLSSVKNKVATFKYGALPYFVLVFISAAFILMQPDTATFGITVIAGFAMYFAAGAKIRHLLIFVGLGILGLAILAFTRPYVMDRFQTFLDPSRDSTGSGYQIQQSMIAIGSGGIFGKGFGQSVQKFNFLPEPIGDSIFAVAGEEFGLVGCIAIILLYLLFVLRGFKIAIRTVDPFGRLVVVGIVILIVSGSFINIASMLGLMPVSGVPLIFVSHGGTALFITLAQVGIILNISRNQKT